MFQVVTVTWDETDPAGNPASGSVTFQLTAPLIDPSGLVAETIPKTYFFISGTGTSDPLAANDSAGAVPAGTAYRITVALAGQQARTFFSRVLHANGTTQTLGYLEANMAVPAVQYAQYLPLPSGEPLAGYTPVVTVDGLAATAWGGSTGDKNYTQDFSVAVMVSVAHNLGKYPAVTVFDSAGDQCEGTVDYTDLNNLTLSFSAPFSGTVTCN